MPDGSTDNRGCDTSTACSLNGGGGTCGSGVCASPWQLQTTFSKFADPAGVVVSPDGRSVWVADSQIHRISVWTKVGGEWSPQFIAPWGVAVAADGQTAWVADTNNNRIAVWRFR
jgi:DNA-binding beta-propeller fold protein YncE